MKNQLKALCALMLAFLFVFTAVACGSETTSAPTAPTESGATTPTKSTETPTASGETPTASGETPTASGETPTASSETPTESTETPTASTETPTVSTETPTEPTETPVEPFVPGKAYNALDERVSVVWDFADPAGESIEGKVKITITDVAAKADYFVYYGNSDGLLPGYAALGTARVAEAGKEYTAFTALPMSALPEGAQSVIVCKRNKKILAYAELPAAKTENKGAYLGSYAAISDVHVFDNAPYGTTYSDINGTEDLKRAIGYINGANVDFTAITGDLTLSFVDDKELVKAELVKSTDILKTAEKPVYVVKGNHDKKTAEDVWKELTGCDQDYAFTHNGDRYIFMSLRTVSNVDSNDDNPYGSAKLNWLKNELEENADKRVFLFMHYPFYGMSGLIPGNRYGFSEKSTEQDTILSLVEAHGAVTVFSGHTHYDFASANTYNDISVYKMGYKNCYAVHIPSVAYPRNSSGTQITEESEGYIVKVYENGIMLCGVDFVTGELSPAAFFYLDTRKVPAEPLATAVKIHIGEGAQVPFGAPVTSVSYRSLDEKVAKVNEKGEITGVGEGKTVIVCTADGFNYRINVEVVDESKEMKGSGTANDPFVVTSAEHFVSIQTECRTGNDLSGVYYALGCDIDLNDCPDYKPMTSSSGGTFAGFFDGRGHKITVKTAKNSADFAVPYFYNMTGTIINTMFDCDMGGCSSTSYCIARTMNKGKMINCALIGSMIGSTVNTTTICGTSSGTTLNNLYINVKVSGTTPGKSESGVSMKGSGTVKNVYYIPNGCTAQFKETAVESGEGVAELLNATLADAAKSAGVDVSALCTWETGTNGEPVLIAK